MAWQRLGRIFCPDGTLPWMRSHAANPFAEHIGGDSYRVYFSCRDDHNRSSIGSVDLDLSRLEVTAVSPRPTLTFGPPGTFDDSGVSLGCIVGSGADRYLYYMGWNLAVTVPWRNSIGLALSRGGSEFAKHSVAPVLDRNAHDPYSLSYPSVLKVGSDWRMWYGSHLSWGGADREMEHVIKGAESKDGICWQPTGKICLAVTEETWAYSRPCVRFEGGIFKMWFSYRGEQYRIGYAESADGVSWRRMDEGSGLTPASAGWDCHAVAYPDVFTHRGRRFMLYCGNGYGATGFGLAVDDD